MAKYKQVIRAVRAVIYRRIPLQCKDMERSDQLPKKRMQIICVSVIIILKANPSPETTIR